MVQSRPGLNLLAWAYMSLLLSGLCYYSLGQYNHNDHMYAVAPVIAQHLRAYSDFAFVQTPLSLLLFAQIYKSVGGPDFYFALRTLSLALQLSIVAMGILFCYRHAQRKLFACVLFVSLYVWFRPDDMIGAEISNYTLSLALTALALLFVDVFRGRSFTPFLAGVAAGLALCAKLSYVYIVGAFALMFIFWEKSPKNLFFRAALYGVGVLVGIAPILYYLVSDSDLFLFENIHFHYLSNIYRGIAPFPGLSNLGIFSASSAVIPLAKLFGACALAYILARLLARIWPPLRVLALPLTTFEKELLCVAAAAAIGVVTPVIVFAQYLPSPAFPLFAFFALYLDRLLTSGRFSPQWCARVSTAALAILMSVAALRVYALTSETLIRQRDGVYGVTAVAHARAVIAGVISQIDRVHPNCHGDLVTAFGVPAIGSGATFAPIDSTGSFAMRLDDIFVQKAPAYRWMTDSVRYMNSRSLILSGFYADTASEPKSPFEKVMDDYASGHGFRKVALGTFIYRPIFLYIPAGCGS
jgi:hypothetical protein